MKFQRAWFTASTFALAAALAACGSSSSDDSAGSGATGSGATGAGATSAGGSSSTAGSTSNSGGQPGSAGTSTGGSSSSTAGAGGAATGTGGTPGSTGGAPAMGGTGGMNMGGAPSAGASSGGASGGMGGAPSTQIPDKKVVMYLPNWNGSFGSWATKIDFSKMTHLNLAFGTMSGSTNWTLGGGSDDGVRQLVSAAHAKNVKVLISIGGADDDIGIINAYGNASNIDPMVNNLDALVTSLTLDGVDVDLERGANLKSSTNFPQFLAKLEAKLRPEGKLVTAALAQYIVEDAGTDQGVLDYIASYDFVNLMIYTTNMSTYTNELNFWTTKVKMPKNKLTWGIEFDSKLTTTVAKQLTTASLGYGGVMVWEYSQPTESSLWPAVQSVL